MSLFFIDAVEHYRRYAEDGTARKGKYALIFEEEYRAAAKLAKYNTLFKEVDLDSSAAEVTMDTSPSTRKRSGRKPRRAIR